MAELLGQILIREGFLNPDDLEAALAAQRAHGGRLGTVLVEMELLGSAEVALCLAQQRGMPVIKESEMEGTADLVHLLPSSAAVRHQAVPAGLENRTLVVAMANAFDPAAVEALELELRSRLVPRLALERTVLALLERVYSVRLRKDPARPIRRPVKEEPPATLGGDTSLFGASEEGFLTSEDDDLYQHTGTGNIPGALTAKPTPKPAKAALSPLAALRPPAPAASVPPLSVRTIDLPVAELVPLEEEPPPPSQQPEPKTEPGAPVPSEALAAALARPTPADIPDWVITDASEPGGKAK